MSRRVSRVVNQLAVYEIISKFVNFLAMYWGVSTVINGVLRFEYPYEARRIPAYSANGWSVYGTT
jgi:hypothetical protein